MPPPPAELFASRIFLGPALRAQPDRRLVDLVREGYDSAFEEIVRRYCRQLDRLAAGIVGGRSEDVTQDAFSKALLALRGSEAEIELRPWLYRIVRNTALNDLRDRHPAAEELSEALAAAGAGGAAAEFERREELADLMERLGALPEPQRAAIVMRELEGLSHEEIAAALGVSGGAARQAIFRARAALRDGLGLLVPMPLLRALVDSGGDAGRGGAIATGAGSAGGAALGGFGAGGALKVGIATVLVAGTVGAGVAIEHHHAAGTATADAATVPLKEPAAQGTSTRQPPTSRGRDGSDGGERSSHRGRGKNGSGDGGGPGRHGEGSGSGISGSDGAGSLGGGSARSDGGSGTRGGPGSGDNGDGGSGANHQGGGIEDSHSGTGSGGGSDDGEASGGSGDGGGSGSDEFVSGDSVSPGSGSSSDDGTGDPVQTLEPAIEEPGTDGGSGSSGGSDDGGGDTSSLDGSSEISP